MSVADLLPELDALATVVSGMADGEERAVADALADLAGRLSAASASLQQLASGRDAQAAAALAGIARLRAEVAALAAQPATPGGVPAGGTAGVPAALLALKPTGARSGLPWASTWRHPNAYAGTVRPAFEGFEAYRGRKLDGLHVFMQGWQGATPATWPGRCWPTAKPATPGGPGEGALWWLARDGIDAYLTWPMFPDQGLPAGKARFQAVLDGAYDACHSAAADRVLATGAAVRAIRPGHEANMGDLAAGTGSYPWSVAYAQGDLPLYRAAYAHVATLLQARFPNALLDFNCLRKLTNVRTFDDIFPGPPFRIISGEVYGNDDRIATPAGLAAFMTAGTPDFPLGPESWAACAAKRGCLYAVPEWAPTVPPGREAARDVPAYVAAMYGHFARHAGILAYESLFGNDDPSSGLHSLWDPTSVPACSAAYASCWKLPA